MEMGCFEYTSPVFARTTHCQSGGFLQPHDGRVLWTGHDQLEHAACVTSLHVRSRTPGIGWVPRARLQSGSLVGRTPGNQDFHRSRAVQELMRTLDVVPVEEAGQFRAHPGKAKRNEEAPRELVLQRQDESFGDCDAAVSSDRPESWLDPAGGAPLSVVVAELGSVVGDDVLGMSPDARGSRGPATGDTAIERRGPLVAAPLVTSFLGASAPRGDTAYLHGVPTSRSQLCRA